VNDLPVGRIAGLFGIRGELKCDPTRSGRALFLPGAVLRCVLRQAQDGKEPQDDRGEVVHIESVREHKGRLLIALDEAQDADEAEAYVGARFYAPREALDVADDEYLDVDLVGCAVAGTDGRDYGKVQRVEHHAGNDMLIVSGRMLPMVKAFIRSIDIGARKIAVEVPPGLLDDDAIISD
jgi:16S rRNA processing protein RimM